MYRTRVNPLGMRNLRETDERCNQAPSPTFVRVTLKGRRSLSALNYRTFPQFFSRKKFERPLLLSLLRAVLENKPEKIVVERSGRQCSALVHTRAPH